MAMSDELHSEYHDWVLDSTKMRFDYIRLVFECKHCGKKTTTYAEYPEAFGCEGEVEP